MKRFETEILILGAGFSGIMCAKMLADSGIDVCVLEKEKSAGGLADTLSYKGFRFDLGGHRLNFSDHNDIDYISDILGEELLRIKKNSRIFSNGAFAEYPPNIRSGVGFPKRKIAKIFLELLLKGKKTNIESFEDWCINNFGKTIYEMYFKDYTEKVWGVDGKGLSKSWADKRIGTNSLWKMLRNLVAPGRDSIETCPFFYYPRHGIGSIIDRVIDEKSRSFELLLDFKIKKIELSNDHLKSLTGVLNGIDTEIVFKTCISSIPIVDMIPLLGIPSDDVLTGLKYRSLIVVNIIFDVPRIFTEHWMYYPDKEIVFSRLHEPKNWSPYMVEDNSKTGICFEIFCDAGDDLWQSSDDDLFNRVCGDLIRLGIAKENMILDYFVKRIDKAYPLYYLGSEKPLAAVKKKMSDIKNLFLIGRTGSHLYFDMDECLNDVKSLVSKIGKKKRDNAFKGKRRDEKDILSDS